MPIFCNRSPTSGMTILSLSQPALIFTVTGIFGTASITAIVISSIRHRSLSAAEPPPFFVTFGTGQP